MPLASSIQTLLSNVKNAHPDYNTEQIREETYNYLTNIVVPVIPEREVINSIQTFRSNDNPNPRPMSHYTTEERAIRKNKSDIVRRVLIEENDFELNGHKVYTADGTSYLRRHQRLFKNTPANATEEQKRSIKQYNDEIALLFPSEKRQEKEKILRDRLIENGRFVDEQDADIQIRETRKQIVMQRLHEAYEFADKLNDMINIDLPEEWLEENIRNIFEMGCIITESMAFLDDTKGDDSLYDLNDEERAFVEEVDRHLNGAAFALNRINMIANPLFEYLDEEAIFDYDFEHMEGVGDINENGPMAYGDRAALTDEGKLWRDEQRKRDPRFYDAIAGTTNDCLVQFINDATFASGNLQSRNLENILNGNCLTNNDEILFFPKNDQDKTYDLKSDITKNAYKNVFLNDRTPAIIRRGERMIAVQNVKGTIKEIDPEVIFNYKLRDRTNDLVSKMSNADPWYHTSSDAFKAMRNAFDEVNRLGQLQTGADIQKFREKYSELLSITNDYLDTKKNHDQKKYTLLHVDMANSLKQFAEKKLEQLKMVENVRLTKKRFAGKTPEEKMELSAAQDKVGADVERLKKLRSDPSKQLLDSLQKTLDSKLLSDVVKKNGHDFEFELNSISQINKGTDLYKGQPDVVQRLVGGIFGIMIAEQLIKNERKLRGSDYNGELENLFKNATKADFIHLGELAAMEKIGKKLGTNRDKLVRENIGADHFEVMSPEEMQLFVEGFDPVAAAKNITEKVYAEKKVSLLVEKLEGKYVNSIKSIRQTGYSKPEECIRNYANSWVVAMSKDNLTAGNNEPIDAGYADDFLSAAVISSILQTERAASGGTEPGYFEKKFEDPDCIRGELCPKITATEEYKAIRERFVDANGCIPLDRLHILVDEDVFGPLTTKIITETEREVRFTEIKNKVSSRYSHDIKPIRDDAPDEYEKQLANVADYGIMSGINEIMENISIKGENLLDADSATLFMTSCVVYDAVVKERELTGDDHIGEYEAQLAIENNELNSLRESIARDGDFKDLVKKYTDEQGKMTLEKMESFINSGVSKKMAESMLAASDIFERENRNKAMSLIDSQMKNQFIDTIKPIRGNEPDEYEKALAEFAKSNISDTVREYIDNNNHGVRYFNSEVADLVVASSILTSVVLLERANNNGNQPEFFERTVATDNDAVFNLREKICATPAYKKMMKAYTTPDGKMSVQNLSALLEKREPQKIALGIIKEAAAEKAKAEENKKGAEKAKVNEKAKAADVQKKQAPQK